MLAQGVAEAVIELMARADELSLLTDTPEKPKGRSGKKRKAQ